jgi:hypothetical protein
VLKKTVPYFLLISVLLSSAYVIAITIPAKITEYYQEINSLNRQFIENLPIYEDYVTVSMEEELRKFLLNAHISKSIQINGNPINKDSDISVMVNKKLLVRADPENAGWYFYNVPDSYRYLNPITLDGLIKISARFNENIKKKNSSLPDVKFAISSALRPAGYNSKISKINSNVSLVSTHSYGTSFDIFHDEYFVVIPVSDNLFIDRKNNRISGFLLGAGLRRQFRAVMMETLLQLQEEGLLYAILEKRQRCYHITIIK